MGREIRRVPPNWNHPVDSRSGQLKPMFDETFEQASTEWKNEFAEYYTAINGDYYQEDRKADDGTPWEFWEWSGDPPNREYYRPWKDEEATWYQVWETVSEGTPVSPPFETKEELIEYLVKEGDFWDQKRREGGWDREAATKFVGTGWAVSFMVNDGVITQARDKEHYNT